MNYLRILVIFLLFSSTALDAFYLQTITQDLDEKLIFGIVLYTGNQVVSLNKKLHALPISVLWSK